MRKGSLPGFAQYGVACMHIPSRRALAGLGGSWHGERKGIGIDPFLAPILLFGSKIKRDLSMISIQPVAVLVTRYEGAPPRDEDDA